MIIIFCKLIEIFQSNGKSFKLKKFFLFRSYRIISRFHYFRYAPESLRDGKFSPRSDVWSFGVTMYETFSFGDDPKLPEFDSNGEIIEGIDKSANNLEGEGGADLLKALERGARLPCPNSCPQEFYVKIMYPCWNLESHLRPDFAKLCQDIQALIDEY